MEYEVKITSKSFQSGCLVKAVVECNGYTFDVIKEPYGELGKDWNIYVQAFQPEETFCLREQEAVLAHLRKNYTAKTKEEIEQDKARETKRQEDIKGYREAELLKAIENIRQYPDLAEKYLK